MSSIAHHVEQVVANDPLLRFGLHEGLLNLTRTARFIQPAVAASAQKPAGQAAILMALSRLQRDASAEPIPEHVIRVGRLSVHSGLAVATFTKSPESHDQVNRLFARIQDQRGYITVTEGTTEITAIVDEGVLTERVLTQPPRRVRKGVSALGIQIAPGATTRPGILHAILQQIALQGICLIEVASTTTEFSLYMDESDVRLAFDAIYHRFSRRRPAQARP